MIGIKSNSDHQLMPIRCGPPKGHIPHPTAQKKSA